MRRGRRGRQTRGKRLTIRWGRFLLFLTVLVALAATILLVIHMLNGEGGPLQSLFAAATPTPAGQPISLRTTPAQPTTTPAPSGVALAPAPGTEPEAHSISTALMIDGEEAESFERDGDLRFGGGSTYASIPGLLTFGGNHYRNTFTYGTQSAKEKKLEIIHEESLGGLKTWEERWSGVSFTGMPIIVEWPESTRRVLGIGDEFKEKSGFTEVIYPADDGYIYFLELSTGARTREPIKLGVVTKGTAALDPRGYPLLYTGQGDMSTNDAGKAGAWFRVVDLIQNKVVWDFGQRDRFAYREWQAYSSSALVHAGTDTLIIPGENGVLYTVKLNAAFDPAAGTVSLNPGGLQKYRYTADGYASGADAANKRMVGTTGSLAAYRNYGFFTDNGGLLQCVDLNTLSIRYAVDVTDASDSTPVIEEAADGKSFYIYTGSKVVSQPGAAQSGSGKIYHRKIDGLTGSVLWEKEWDAGYNSDGSGGTRGTPHIGRGDLSDIVIYNATLVPVTYADENGNAQSGPGGRITVYRKSDGELLSAYEQAGGYWSSPVVIYDSGGAGYLLQCDRSGILRMHDPRDLGTVYTQLNLGSRVEATPAVYKDYLVVGTRGSESDSPKIVIVKIS